MVKVSVIIPVYNAAFYINDCIDSVLNQTLDDVEIICVDDGSTDNSLEILKSYGNKIKIISQDNKGAGAARNKGLEYANGEYIYFIDADDILFNHALENVYEISQEKSLDVLMFKLFSFNDNTKKYFQEDHYDMKDIGEIIENKIFNYSDLNDLIFKVSVSPVNKLYNSLFLKKYNIKFPEGVIFEDNVFFWEVFLNARKIFFYQELLYLRRRHSKSITGNYDKNFSDTLRVHNIIFNIFKEHGIFDKYKTELLNKKVRLANYRFNQMNNKFCEEFYKDLKEDFILMNETYDDLFIHLNNNNQIFFRCVMDSRSSDELKLLFDVNILKSKINKFSSNNKKLETNIKTIKNENNLMLYSNSWKITKPLRLIRQIKKGSLKEMLINKSGSYKFYKKNYLLLNKKINSLNEILKKKNNKIKKLEKKLKNYEKIYIEKINKIQDFNEEFLDLEINMNKNLEDKSSLIIDKLVNMDNNFNRMNLIDREIHYGLIFNSTITNSDWLKQKSFSLNNGAANYSFMYVLFRILDEVNPKNILELGLGQTTKLTSQYANFFSDVKLLTIDGDKDWIDTFSNKLSISDNINIVYNDLETFSYNNSDNLRYKDILDTVGNEKFDLIVIDGPQGFFSPNFVMLDYSRSNIWELIDNNLADDFVIIIDDFERKGEKNTINHVEELLKEKNITFYNFRCIGLKEQYVICSEKYKFISWF